MTLRAVTPLKENTKDTRKSWKKSLVDETRSVRGPKALCRRSAHADGVWVLPRTRLGDEAVLTAGPSLA